MEKMAKEIVKQCEGLPVAIIRLAQELAGRESLAELKIVHENTVSFLKDRLSQVLAPSIHDLPDQLKLCFLYLGLWPEDATIIDVEKLHHFWLVEGLVKLQDLRIGETSLNVVEQYLTELARRSLVEVEEEEAPSIRRLKCCRVHRIMRSLCISKGSHIGSSYTIDCRLGSYSTSSASGNKARRLFVYLESPEDISSILANKELTRHLHCIQFLGTHEQQRMEPVRLSGKLKDKELTLLKLLDFDGVDFRQYELPTKKGMSGLLEGICKLVHLRYLSFKGCYLDKLPSTISNFSFLQILDLRTKDSSTEVTLPNVLWMIGKLKHLYLPRMFRTNDGEKLQLDGLTELETLENFITKVCNVGDMHSLTRLQYVAVIIDGNLSDLRFISQYMRKTSNKQIRLSIDLRSFDCFVEERHSSLMEVLQFQAVRIFCIQGHIHELPPSCDISPSLTKIVLRGSELEKDPMEKLAELPCLRVLILDNAFVGTDMVCPTSGFPELKRLELITFQFLERWKVESESMPKVFNIKIEYCEKLASIPDGFECLTTLKELEIAKMPPSFEDRLREIDGKHGEDMAKVKNVKITFSQ